MSFSSPDVLFNPPHYFSFPNLFVRVSWRSSDESVDGPTERGKGAHGTRPPWPPIHEVPCPASPTGGPRSINRDEGFLPDPLGLRTTSNLEVTLEPAAQTVQAKAGFGEAPCLHATDSQRCWGAREVGRGVVGRGVWPPPGGLPQTGLGLTPGPD